MWSERDGWSAGGFLDALSIRGGRSWLVLGLNEGRSGSRLFGDSLECLKLQHQKGFPNTGEETLAELPVNLLLTRRPGDGTFPVPLLSAGVAGGRLLDRRLESRTRSGPVQICGSGADLPSQPELLFVSPPF